MKKQLIYNHEIYVDDGRDKPRYGSFMGFGGAEWKIKHNDGTETDTNNLWAIGKIPQSAWETTPDNCVILQPVTRKSMLSDVERTMWLPMITPAQHLLFEQGKHIQEVLTNYTDSEREFLMTGISDDEWDEAFKDDED
jgi:hypothetical protein